MPYAIDFTQTERNWRKSVSARLGGLPSSWLTGSKTWNPASISDKASLSTTVTVTGAVAGNYALASFTNPLLGMTLGAEVSAPDTVTCVLSNLTGGALDLASGTLSAAVFVP